MQKLEKQLEGLSEKTVNMYLTKLRILNEGKDFSNLAFLKKTSVIQAKLAGIENDNTRKSYVASIIAILNRQEDKSSKKANDIYKKMFLKERNIFSEKVKAGEKSVAQKENWIEQADVMAIRNALADKVDAIENKTKLTEREHRIVEDWLLLSLYVLQPPRRNADYYMMKVGSGEDKNFNYVDLEKGVYVFNNFKTSNYGAQEIVIPETMRAALNAYLELTGLKTGDFLLFQSDTARTSSNIITKTLNRIFGKKIGSSMLRHIFLTDKYSDVKSELSADSAFMSHGAAVQQSYILK